MEKIHNLKKRMPLIIPREQESKWIDTKLSKEDIQSLIKPYAEDEMFAYTISNIANSTKQRRNVPEILDRVDYPELEE